MIDPLMATEADHRAAEWLQKRRFWNWTDEDQAALDAWLSQSPAHLAAFWRLDAAWERTERLAAIAPAMREQKTEAGGKFRWSLFASLAASVLAVLVGAGAYFHYSQPAEKIFTTPVGGREIVTLADGSQIELNTNTELRARVEGGVRTVALVKGEAYFHIRHDPSRPFVVTAENGRVLDLGTRFVVRKDAERLDVALLDGSVRFEPAQANRAPEVLKPGEVVHATSDTLSVAQEPVKLLERDLSWRNGMLVFDHASVAAAVKEFNRYNDEKLVVAGDGAGALTFSSAFPINGTQAFVRLAQKTLGLHVERRGGSIVISR